MFPGVMSKISLKNRQSIKDSITAGRSTKCCHVRSVGAFDGIDNAVTEWFNYMCEKHGEIPVMENIICEKALKFALKLEK